jgi:hypothetical protein
LPNATTTHPLVLTDYDAGPKEWYGERRAGRAPPLSRGNPNDVYMQEIPKSVQATVDSINAKLRRKPTSVRKRKASVVKEG